MKNDEIYKKSIEENEKNIMINIQLPVHRNNELFFELKLKNKNDKEKINDLTQLIIKQNEDITDLKNEINQLKNEDIQLKEEFNNLKEKLSILWKEWNKIQNLNSKIINGNEQYNEQLKEWINPSKKIKAELLYRLSENGNSKATFHELCDNKGPTLTLFHVDNGNKVGIYTPLSWDFHSCLNYKRDIETFIFNLNTNKKYAKLSANASIFCTSSTGPCAVNFGCYDINSMNSITLCGSHINEFYIGGSEILPSDNQTKSFDLIETEVYKIIIE